MEQLTKNELLAKCKSDYPIGAKIKSAQGTIGIIKGDYSVTNNLSIKVYLEDSWNVFLFDSMTNKWAEIISVPRQHDGYIVPFDIKTWKLKEGEIILLGQKATNSYFLPHGGFVPIEIVETWEKHYPEQTETAKPDYSKVIELIEGEIKELKYKRVDAEDIQDLDTEQKIKHTILFAKNLVTKIKAL